MADKGETVAIVGVGLIGGSIGMSLRRQGLAERVIGIGRRRESLEEALRRGAVDEIATDVETGVSRAQLTVVCVPVEQIPEAVERAAASCDPSAVITDAGSIKGWVVEQVERRAVPGQAPFVGSHPLAGSEKQGVAHARDDLFVDRTVVLTPRATTPADACGRVERFWRGLGANVVQMDAWEHDRAVAATSHAPHIIAAALAAATPEEFLSLAATGWLDTTRIAAGDVELWRQILKQNRASVLRSLEQFGKVLDSFSRALEQQDDEALAELLAAGKQRRDALAD